MKLKQQLQLGSSVHLPFSFAVGATASAFYRALRDEKTIYGTRCDSCGSISVPARSCCSRCRKGIDHRDSEKWVVLPEHGELAGWCETPSQEGFFTALIQLAGAGNLLLHRIGQCHSEQLYKGMQVRAVWKDFGEGAITDIICFRPDIKEVEK